MKRHWILALAVSAVVLGLTIQGQLAAEVKKAKEPEKKKTEPAKPIVVEGELTNVDLKDKLQTNSYCKTYTFKMEKDKSYQIELTSNTLRPYLRLENNSGNQVAVDFDQFGAGNPTAIVVHRSSKTEDYTIVATSMNPNSQGKFTLTVKELTGDEGKPIDLKLNKGRASFTGNIAPADPRYQGKIHKLFLVKFEEGKTYQIDNSSRAFDAYLYLIGPDGTILAQNDDANGSLDSQIIHRANKAGEYRIVATSLGGRSTGAFTFTVTER